MAQAEEIVLELQRELVLLGARVDYLETLEKGVAAAAQPPPIFLTGFEDGVPPHNGPANFLYDDAVTPGAMSIVTTPVHSGTYALQIAAAGLTTRTGWNFSSGEIIARFYIRFSSLPAATVGLAHVLTTSGTLLLFRYNQATGKFNVIWNV